MKPVEWAHKYVDVGWSIFPLEPKSKRPHFAVLADTGFRNAEGNGSWDVMKTTRPTHKLVDAWFTLDPNANIGLVCGKISGVTVIDIDYRPDKYPDMKLIDPYEIYYEVCDLTMTSITGSGGLHVFCKYDDSVPISVKSVHPQIDVKNDNSYIVLPPSWHDDFDKQYLFDPLFTFTENNVKNLASFPVDLKIRLVERSNEKMNNIDWKRVFSGVREHIDGRNHAATKIVGKLINALWDQFGRDEKTLQIIWDMTEAWNKKNKPPLPERELKSVFKSITMRHLYDKSD